MAVATASLLLLVSFFLSAFQYTTSHPRLAWARFQVALSHFVDNSHRLMRVSAALLREFDLQ